MTMRAASTFFWRRPYWYLALLLVPPLLWFGTVYLGSLFALLAQSFYRIDDFTAQVVREPTLATYEQLVTQPANIDIVVRTVTMAIVVTITCAIIALPIATYMARYASGRMKAFFYVGVMLPMWTSYLVKVYAWRLLLAREGIIAGSVLAFARSMGEFGATIMIAGSIAGETQTIPLFIYDQLETPGGLEKSWTIIAVSIVLATAALVVGELLERHGRRRLRMDEA